MHDHHPYRLYSIILLIALALTGCAAPTAPATGNESTPVPSEPAGQTEAPPVPSEPATEGAEASQPASNSDEFKAALLQAMMEQDTEKLQGWMTTPFITGGWGADISDSAPADALQYLYNDFLDADSQLMLVKDADLKALLRDIDPLSIPRAEAGVIEAALVSGWGKEGRDEAVLFIARDASGNLKWHGWMEVRGGLSGARLGGNQVYTNQTHGYRVYLPKDYEVEETNPSNVLVMAPGEGHPGEGRAAAFIMIEPANGRSVEEIVEQTKADLPPGFEIPPGTVMGFDDTMAIILSGLPGQDSNRQLFAVHNDLLYHIMFVPDAPQVGMPYQQMEDLYAMIVNTFHFTE